MKKIITASVVVLMAIMTAPVMAHHSAAQFDFANTVVVTGRVVKARLANPHMRLILEVTDDERGTRDIEFEGHSRNNMSRQGMMPDMFQVDDTISIRIAPMRNGDDGGYVTALRMPDGEEIGRVTGAD